MVGRCNVAMDEHAVQRATPLVYCTARVRSDDGVEETSSRVPNVLCFSALLRALVIFLVLWFYHDCSLSDMQYSLKSVRKCGMANSPTSRDSAVVARQETWPHRFLLCSTL